MFPLLDSAELYRLQRVWHVCFESVKGEITVVSQIFLDCRPVVFNEIELTVKFRQENAHVASGFNDLLHERLLCQEIRLIFEYTLEAARLRFQVAFFVFLCLFLQSFAPPDPRVRARVRVR
jgi:hypothetical protein